MQRQIIKVDRKARELMQEYKEYSLKVSDLTDQIEKLETERNKWAMKGQKVKDKLEPVKDKLVGKEMGEFEIVINMKSGSKSDEIIIELVDAVEQYKDSYRKRKLQPETK